MGAINDQLGCEDECQFQVNYKVSMKWKSEGTVYTQLFYGVLLWNRKNGIVTGGRCN